jgi:hypothetical protein
MAMIRGRESRRAGKGRMIKDDHAGIKKAFGHMTVMGR